MTVKSGKKRISQKVNYDYLDELCNISGLQNRNDQHINEVAHQKFIELYPKVFYQEKSALPRIPEAHLKRIPKLSDQPVDEKYHDIGSYLKKIRGVLKVEQESLQKREHIDMLIRILKKLLEESKRFPWASSTGMNPLVKSAFSFKFLSHAQSSLQQLLKWALSMLMIC
ncbi:cyclic nucleotide-binding domain-containing protein 1 [Struthio camelus]|uniref:cyclic nucleotide-binding domain-containing protein 1 n=1 Tax=Struthio camelus TaxID=8801 RepID=UPI0036041650